jgi:hypothetical protein
VVRIRKGRLTLRRRPFGLSFQRLSTVEGPVKPEALFDRRNAWSSSDFDLPREMVLRAAHEYLTGSLLAQG